MIHLFSTQPRTLYDLLDVRALLEGESARLAATLGTNAQYLFSLEQELIKLGMQDDGLNELLVSVKKLLAENYPDGVLRPGFA